MQKKISLSMLALASVLSVSPTSAQFADRVVDYLPGHGAAEKFLDPAAALGEPSRITPGAFGGPVTSFNPPYLPSQLVSVGAGGRLTLQLDAPITNDASHPYGIDFLIFGNSGFIGTNDTFDITSGALFGATIGSTRVSVSADGTNFFMLNPGAAPLVDSYYPTEGAGHFLTPVNPGLRAADFGGLADSDVQALYNGSGGGAGYDLSWAQDDLGVATNIPVARFIRIEVIEGHSEIDAVTAVEPRGRTLQENFSANPGDQGWTTFGDAELFRWNSTNQALAVTWDSARPNSYFRLPLGTILTRRDDFSAALDLQLDDIQAGLSTNKPTTFQIAFGFQNSREGAGTNFIRGSGSDSPNLVEFNYFPDTGFGPTVWPVSIASNAVINYNGSDDFAIFALPIGIPMRMTLSYAATNQTLALTIVTNGVLVGTKIQAPLSPGFSDFRLDAFAITSYSDAGQPPEAPGSVLAHGVIDNIVLSVPHLPIRFEQGALVAGVWQHAFISQKGWSYTLEATESFGNWTRVSEASLGTGGQLTLSDPAGARSRFYRVRAERIQ